MSDTDITPDEETAAVEAPEGGKRLEFADTVSVATDKHTLWSVISDPEVLTACVPGADEIERLSKRAYSVAITRGVSHLTVSLSGEVEFVEMDEPDYIVASGFAHDTKTGSDFDVLAAMEMTEVDDETVHLTYSAEVTVSGGVGSLGAGLLRPIVRRDVDTYFDNIRATVEDETA